MLVRAYSDRQLASSFFSSIGKSIHTLLVAMMLFAASFMMTTVSQTRTAHAQCVTDFGNNVVCGALVGGVGAFNVGSVAIGPSVQFLTIGSSTVGANLQGLSAFSTSRGLFNFQLGTAFSSLHGVGNVQVGTLTSSATGFFNTQALTVNSHVTGLGNTQFLTAYTTANGIGNTQIATITSSANGVGNTQALTLNSHVTGLANTQVLTAYSTANGIGNMQIGTLNAHASGVGNVQAASVNVQANGAFNEQVGTSTAMIVGSGVEQNGSNSAFAFGNGITQNGASNSFAFGNGANVSPGTSHTIAMGSNTSVQNSGSLAIGTDDTGAGATTNAGWTNHYVMGTERHTYTAPGITSDLSRSRQSGPTELVTSDAAGNLATDGGELFGAVSENQAGIAIAMAMQAPDLKGLETFGVSLNLGFFEDSTAVAGAVQGVLGTNAFGTGERISVNAGIGVSLNEKGFGGHSANSVVGGRVGIQATW